MEDLIHMLNHWLQKVFLKANLNDEKTGLKILFKDVIYGLEVRDSGKIEKLGGVSWSYLSMWNVLEHKGTLEIS